MPLGIFCLVLTHLAAINTAIRVDWNTNTGPILPPKPQATRRPLPPFREPAPVWEDLGNDIPNPNPYIYVAPPPSRPKQTLYTNVNYGNRKNNVNYGFLSTISTIDTFNQQQNQQAQQVAALSAQYIPNVGTRYVAVVPNAPKAATPAKIKHAAAWTNALSLWGNVNSGYKLQGIYNAKTKKYKTYEKVKYVPNTYRSLSSKNGNSKENAASKHDLPDLIYPWNHGNDQEKPIEENTHVYGKLFGNFRPTYRTTIHISHLAPASTVELLSNSIYATVPLNYHSKYEYIYVKGTTLKQEGKPWKKS